MNFPLVLKKHFKNLSKGAFWFLSGALIATILITGFTISIFETINKDFIYPGIFIDNINVGGKTQIEAENYFNQKNQKIKDVKFSIKSSNMIATASAEELEMGYNSNLLATQAYSIGRSKNLLSNISLVLQAYLSSINLPASYKFSQNKLDSLILPMEEKVNIEPVEALFSFDNGRVTAFRPSSDGQILDKEKLSEEITSKIPDTLYGSKKIITIDLPIKKLGPKITTDKANNLGIKELIGMGTSLFQHSIPNRVFNVNLAASRMNGILVPPGESFSFNKALGDISSFTGYKQAYIISNGKTVLGDGGGVCQVSTTFFRALLNAGVPITERHSHAYRVGYYEQDSPPGIDATIYSPSVDLSFTNDTGHYILIQTAINPAEQRLTFFLYGTSDGRKSEVSIPVITSQTPPPPPLYQEDPTRPKGSIEQTEFEAWGANVYFTRTVTKNGETLISEKYNSNYQPWKAVYLTGTKE